MTPVDTLVVKCRDRAGLWLGDLELADSAGEATIHSDDGADEISIAEASSYALLLRRASDRPMRFAAPITSERIGGGDPFGSLRGHVGLGAVALGFDDAEGLPLWRRLVRIRPSKFKDLVEFERMVDEICELRVSLALDLRGSTSAPWASIDIGRARPPEEELAVLRFAIDRERLLEGLEHVARNAHARLERDDVPARLGEGAIDPSRFALHLAGGGRRSPVPIDHPLHSVAASLPSEAPSARRIDSHDTAANRFAKFVAKSFRDRLELALRSGIPREAPIAHWASSMIAQLERSSAHAPFDRVGAVARIDLGDPTLQRRHGYRLILRAYLAARAGLAIRWPELSDIVFAETRDVPQLYEIWCLIHLRRAIEQQFGVTLTAGHFCLTGERITLPRGSVAAATAPVTIAGRSYRMRLWYNRTFSPSGASEQGHFAVHPVASGTWSKPMKPDFSIELTSLVGDGDHEASSWFVHLDAKYRLKKLPSTADHDESRGSFAPDDIDKMHAYLAGIQGSRAAHILYPGDRTVFFRRGDSSDSVGAFSAVPGRMETFGKDLRDLIEATFEADQPS
ncbi:DUF2357 domain-containing protein [Xanthobacter flavus]|uniref:DUF2357 domain-containing protein n=1 Tax=Xanthobacter flavus TaxID=281 RepID=UPI00372B3097